VQFCERRCGLGCMLFRIRVEVCIRSATVVMRCCVRRHFDALEVMGRGSEATWYQAGSWARSTGDRRIAASFTLYLFATLSILIMSLLSSLSFSPLDATFHICRKGFCCAWDSSKMCGILWSGLCVRRGQDGSMVGCGQWVSGSGQISVSLISYCSVAKEVV
jgi:hypothetical protein